MTATLCNLNALWTKVANIYHSVCDGGLRAYYYVLTTRTAHAPLSMMDICCRVRPNDFQSWTDFVAIGGQDEHHLA